jgi:tetratricopeptide (TPR) repeat protein
MKEAASAALARVKALDEALARAAPSRDLAMLYDDLSDYYFRAGCYNDALATRERAIAVGTALADEHLLVRSEIGRVVTLSMLGQLRAADVAARGLIPRAQAAGNREALRLALAQVAEAAMVGGEFFQSREYRTRELSVARQVDPRLVAPFTRANLAQLTLYLGDWATAQRHAEQALKDLRAVGSVARAVYPLSFLGELALRRGDWPEAVRLLEECIAAAEPIGDVQVLRYAQRLLAERDTLDGHPDAALARLEPLLDRPGLEELDVAPLLVTLAWAYLTLGDVVTAAQRCAAGLARATAQGNCLARQDALRVSGMVLARQADWSQARSLFEEAATLARSMPYPYAEARALAEAGRLQGRRGGRERETIALRQAQAIFARLGAAWDAHRVEQTVAALT